MFLYIGDSWKDKLIAEYNELNFIYLKSKKLKDENV